MISVSDELASILDAGGFQRSYVADLIVDGVRVLKDVSLPSCELVWNGNAKIRGQGRAVFEYTDSFGTDVVPEDVTSWLTPYASFLNVSMRVTAGGFTEKVLRGTFKIVGVRDPQGSYSTHLGRRISLGSRVQLQLADLFSVTDRERFPAPSGPIDLSSVFGEIQRVSGLPVMRNVADEPITRAVTYKDNRLDALFDLASMLSGKPYVNANGQVAIDPDEWPVAGTGLVIGTTGSVTPVMPAELTDEGIYNQVVVRSHDDSQTTILATAQLVDGPLRYGGPFGRVPYFASSEFITTAAQAQEYANTLLPVVSSIAATAFTIRCLPDPRREVGDVVPFTYNGTEYLGRIYDMTLPSMGDMTVLVTAQQGNILSALYPAPSLHPSLALYPS